MKNVCVREIGRCIYCPSTDMHPLTDEHIVPKGLNGHEFLGSATCEVCRITIGRFETEVQNKTLWLLRLARNICGHKDKHKIVAYKTINADGSMKVEHTNPANIPYGGALPSFTRTPGCSTAIKGKISCLDTMLIWT